MNYICRQNKQMNINKYIDHTFLKPTALATDIEKLCKEAIDNQFAAVCIPPTFVKKAKALTKDSEVKVATVIGFPFGYSAIEAKIAESVLAILDGADELDVVINLIAVKNADWEYVANELNHIVPIIKSKEKVVKIIVESGILTDEELIKLCELFGPSEIDYMKTSTGYAEVGATLHAVELMRKHLPENIHIKASGGIKTYTFAKELVEAGATRLGCSAGIKIANEEKLAEK